MDILMGMIILLRGMIILINLGVAIMYTLTFNGGKETIVWVKTLVWLNAITIIMLNIQLMLLGS